MTNTEFDYDQFRADYGPWCGSLADQFADETGTISPEIAQEACDHHGAKLIDYYMDTLGRAPMPLLSGPWVDVEDLVCWLGY